MDLTTAISQHYQAGGNPSEGASLARLDADAKLYGTPAYDAFPEPYKQRVAARALELARTAQKEGQQ
ncbi:hypothetical protein [Streptomyces wuyuanensis]|uniref:hypothetical protein n=1 Tax=Streptomyces wuyuanensis TaxID=1196353 RepID=UPI003416DE7B